MSGRRTGGARQARTTVRGRSGAGSSTSPVPSASGAKGMARSPTVGSATARVPPEATWTGMVSGTPGICETVSGLCAKATGAGRASRPADRPGAELTMRSSRSRGPTSCMPRGRTGSAGQRGAVGCSPFGAPNSRSATPWRPAAGRRLYSTMPSGSTDVRGGTRSRPSPVLALRAATSPGAVFRNSSVVGPRRLNTVRQAAPGPTGGAVEARMRPSSVMPCRTNRAVGGTSSPPAPGITADSQ